MNKFKKYTYLLGLACAVLTTACEDQSEEVTALEHDHLFAPFGLEAKVNNHRRTLKLDYKLRSIILRYRNFRQ